MSSEAEQDTKLCGNCKRYIPGANFTIHELHCKRNISVCNLCKEPVPTSEMDEHFATEHAKVTCKCKMTMEKNALEEHELSSCPLRLVKCQFCELELASNKLADHEDYCGTRTEQCETCGRSVMIKDLKDHPKSCGKEPKPKKPGHSQILSDNENATYGTWFESQAIRSIFIDNPMRRMPNQIPSRFYGRTILTKSNDRFDRTETQQAARNRVERANLYWNSPVERHERLPEGRFYAPFLPRVGRSNFDTFQSRSPQDNSHFSIDAESSDNTGFYSKDNKVTPDWQSNHNIFSEGESGHDPQTTQIVNDIQLPCEFCEELFPEHDLILHQSACNPHAFASFCNRRPSPDSLDFAFETNIDRTSQPIPLSERPRTPEPSSHGSQSILLPCEFCAVLMEGDILFHHQDQCDLCPESVAFNSPQLRSLPTNPNEEEKRFLEMPQSQSRSHKDNLLKESSSKPPYVARPRGPIKSQPRQPRVFNLPSAGLVPKHSNLSHFETKRTNMEENLRVFRSQQNPHLYSQSHRDDTMNHNATARNPNTGNHNQATKLNTRTGDVEKEE